MSELTRHRFESIDDAMAQVVRAMGPAERLAIAFGMWRYARDTIHRIVQQQHPDWLPQQVQQETARRILHGAF